ncbi:MAG: hypothetical protein AAF639_15805 [Chloroflexota bacterium]
MKPNRINTSVLTVGFQAITLLLLALHIYVYTFPPTPTPIPEPTDPEAAWWGLWPVTYLPLWAMILGSLTVLLSVLFAMFASTKKSSFSQKLDFWHITIPITIFLFAVVFLSFPIAHTRWGDAYILTNAIGWPDPALRLTHSWQAPLDVYLHSQIWLNFHELYNWTDATPVYRILSPIAGVLYLLVTWALSRRWHRAYHMPMWVSFGLLSSLGIMQLFFGYIENYSFAAVGILCYLWLALGVLNGQRPLWLAAIVLAFTHATHPSTIVLAPSLLYCGCVQWRANEHKHTLSILTQIAIPMLVIGVGTFALMEAGGHGISALLGDDKPGGGDGRWLVPLWATTTRWEHYTLFSWLHLRDFLNEQLLVAPVILPSLVWLLAVKRHWPKHVNTHFLGIATSCYLLFVWLWNPDYGGQRDWDLFSLAAIPMTVLLIELLAQFKKKDGATVWIGVMPLIVLQGLHTAAWVYQNTLDWSWP